MSPPCGTHLQSSSLWTHCPSPSVITCSPYHRHYVLSASDLLSDSSYSNVHLKWFWVLGSLKNYLKKKSFPCWSYLWGTWRIDLPFAETKMRSCWFSKFLLRLEGLEKCNFKGITPFKHHWISQTLSQWPWNLRFVKFIKLYKKHHHHIYAQFSMEFIVFVQFKENTEILPVKPSLQMKKLVSQRSNLRKVTCRYMTKFPAESMVADSDMVSCLLPTPLQRFLMKKQGSFLDLARLLSGTAHLPQ